MRQKFIRLIASINNVFYLNNTGASLSTIGKYLKDTRTTKRIGRQSPGFFQRFKRETAGLDLSTRWFDGNILLWNFVFDQCRIDRKAPLEMLEIGSWEGLSANFLLWQFPAARLTCVDTWEGAEEHKDGTCSSQHDLGLIEARFDSNCQKFASRITKLKKTSSQFFANHDNIKLYDIIYIDGSHHSFDVVFDAVSASKIIKDNGLIIFDDYLWKNYSDKIKNPAMAINWFLNATRKEFELIYVGTQVVVRKTGNKAPGK